jgi:predicted RNase H-like HicB family nuclease
MTEPSQYPVLIRPLDSDDGGGFVALVPDLPGCISDGATAQEALANVQDAITCWIEAATDMGRPIPKPRPYRPQRPQPLKKYG